MKSSIDVLANYKKRKVAILADMLELGDYSQQLHEEVGSYVASKGIDILVCVGKEAKYIPDFDECVSYIKNNIEQNDIVMTLGAGTVTKIGPMLIS